MTETPETPDQEDSQTEENTPGPYPHNPDIPGPEDGEDNGEESDQE